MIGYPYLCFENYDFLQIITYSKWQLIMNKSRSHRPKQLRSLLFISASGIPSKSRRVHFLRIFLLYCSARFLLLSFCFQDYSFTNFYKSYFEYCNGFMVQSRVAHFAIFQKLVLAITSKISRIPTDYIRQKIGQTLGYKSNIYLLLKFSIFSKLS